MREVAGEKSTKPHHADCSQDVDGRFGGHAKASAPEHERSVEGDDDDRNQDYEEPASGSPSKDRGADNGKWQQHPVEDLVGLFRSICTRAVLRNVEGQLAAGCVDPPDPTFAGEHHAREVGEMIAGITLRLTAHGIAQGQFCPVLGVIGWLPLAQEDRREAKLAVVVKASVKGAGGRNRPRGIGA